MPRKVVEGTEEARQGESKGWVRRVLVISTAAAVIAMLGFVFAYM